MCGICGTLIMDPRGQRPDRGLVERMVGALVHRGPDSTGGYADRHLAMGHARLAIIDLQGGEQPMPNEDRSLWLVFNGEIYNYPELTRELTAKGHVFRSRSDTEVILHAYEQWGRGCLERFEGQFAFALWDRQAETLFLARDRVGIRPLFYTTAGGRFTFASEVKALLQDPAVPRRLSPEGLRQAFTFWAPVAPRTPFEGIWQLPPGSSMEVRVSGHLPEPRRYWVPGFEPDPPRSFPSEPELDSMARGLLDRLGIATRERLSRADVPVGVYLSGGLDSSTIAALAASLHRGRLSTFSVRFEDQRFDEGRFQDLVIDDLGTSHSHVTVAWEDVAQVFPRVVRHAEAPLLRAAPAPLLHLSGLVADQGFKVVLTGEGADEVLAGYDLFKEHKVRLFWARDPASRLRPLLLERLYPWMSRRPSATKALQRRFFGRGLDRPGHPFFSHWPRWTSTWAVFSRLLTKDLAARLSGYDPDAELAASLPVPFSRWDPLARAQYLEMLTLMAPYILSSQGDRMLMASSVEGRFPFLDSRVMDYAFGLPASARLRILDEKHLLKRAARGLVPEQILSRAKQPYRAPDSPPFALDQTYVPQVTSEEAVREAGLFEPSAVGLLMDKARRLAARDTPNTLDMAVVGVVSTQLLHRELIRGEGLSVPGGFTIGRWFG